MHTTTVFPPAAARVTYYRDVAPTLLWLMGAPLPSTSDGRVIREAFAPHERPVPLRGRNGHQPLVAAGDGDHDPVTRRLKALGYI